MFKLIARKVTKNGVVGIEQVFTDGEKDFAVATAAKLDATPGFSDVRLLETVHARGKVITLTDELVLTPKAGGGSEVEFKGKGKFLTVARFGWVAFKAPAPKVSKPRTRKPVAAPASEFDVPAVKAPRKRLTKRQREFGVDADKTLAAAL